MEALPKLPLISFEPKQSTEPTQFGPKLKQYIAENYHEDPESYNNEIYQLEGLRSSAVRPSLDAAGLKSIKRYYCQLVALQSRFPMAKGQAAAVNFTWKDLYEKISCTLPDIRFEMACILYNIGVLHTILGSRESRSTADSLKCSCTHFQSAAWVFQYLKDHYPQPSGVDLSVDVLKFMQEVCYAQAQECILEKSIADNKKSSVVGAVGKQVLLFYKNAETFLGSSTETLYDTMGAKIYKPLHAYVLFKQAYIECIVCLYQGLNAEEQQKMGERVAFYQASAAQLASARKIIKILSPTEVYDEALTFLNDIVEAKKKAAKNENEFIYHDEVPDKDLLTNLKPVSLVKALPINFNDPEISSDIFSRLVPMGAHEASSMYSEEKAKLLRHVIEMVDSKNTELSEFMSSLQLDHLEYLDNMECKLPQEIVDRCAAMNAKAEVIQTLVDSMNNLAEIISNVEQSLGDVKELIQEETAKEKEYQKVIGPRPPSIVCTDLSREANKYQEAHNRTTDSNQVLHKAMVLHLANLRLLALPLEDLEKKIPSVDKIDGLDRPAMLEMKRVLGKCREMQTQRETLVQKLREALNSDDITPILLSRAGDPLTDLFQQEIDKHTAQVKIIEQNMAAQENIINKLTSVYASYGESRRLLTDVIRKRESLLNALITSYDTHEDLLSKSQKGLEFYRKLQSSVNQLQTRVKSACQVQNEERTQLLSKQNKAIPAAVISSTPSPAPSPPVSDGTSTPKLKDYLPFMKNRLASKISQPAVPPEPIQNDVPYPENAYPTSLRPTPVGSEANTDPQPANYYDSYSHPSNPSQYNYGNQYPYSQGNPNAYPGYNDGTAESKDVYANTTNPTMPYHTNPAYNTQYAQNPTSNYYNSQVVDSNHGQAVAPVSSQYGVVGNTYTQNTAAFQTNPTVYHQEAMPSYQPTQQSYVQPTNNAQTIPSQVEQATSNPTDENALNAYMAQMQINQQTNQNYYKAEPVEYTQAYYNNANTQPLPSESPQINAPAINPENYGAPVQNYHYSYPYMHSQSYPETADGRESVNSTPLQYSYGYQPQDVSTLNYVNYNQAAVVTPSVDPSINQYNTQMHVEVQRVETPLDDPIKSHADVNKIPTQNYQQAYVQQPTAEAGYPNVAYSPAPPNYDENSSVPYQSYSNHPGYSFNTVTGVYDYNYGYQSTMNTVTPNATNAASQPPWQSNTYSTAGSYETVQSPSGSVASNLSENKEKYYHTPYGYQSVDEQGYSVDPSGATAQTNYGANSNQSTYIQSTNSNNTASTFSSNSDNLKSSYQHESEINTQEQNLPQEEILEVKSDKEDEPLTMDLLSGLDFNIDTKPLTPEIKVPPISESQLRKIQPKLPEKQVQKVVVKELVRPDKVELFTDPVLLNKFTQEVQRLQKTVDGFSNKTQAGVVLLDSMWKDLQDHQAQEYSKKSKRIASENTQENVISAIVPYDDSRVILKSNPDAYINASYYEQLSSWCIPLIVANIPEEKEQSTFWTAMIESKVKCIACLVSEIELQGYARWPTAKGQSLEFGDVTVTLDDVKCNVHWTERTLTVTKAKSAAVVTHYQVNVYPAKVVCGPIVLLADKMLSHTYTARSGKDLGVALVQCGTGGGRSSLFALLLAAMCQVKAGQTQLCDILQASCLKLYEHRYNALEDTKYLADAYKTVLYYAQGVLCSGSTAFNGESIVAAPSSASTAAVPPTLQQSSSRDKLHKFSRESFEEMKQTAGLKTGEMNDPLSFLDPLWSLKKK